MKIVKKANKNEIIMSQKEWKELGKKAGWIKESQEDKYYHIEGPIDLKKTEKWADGYLVQYPVSYKYNGGTIIDGEWYKGFKVPPPEIPEGYELVDIGIGLQLNSKPPIATKYLKPIS